MIDSQTGMLPDFLYISLFSLSYRILIFNMSCLLSRLVNDHKHFIFISIWFKVEAIQIVNAWKIVDEEKEHVRVQNFRLRNYFNLPMVLRIC